MPARLRTFRVQLGLVAAVGALVRLAWVVGYGRTQEVAGDQVFYHYQALALADGAGFVNPYAWNDPVTPLAIPTAAHPPLYSLYLALWSLVGLDTPFQHRLVSTLLGVACVVVVGLVGRLVAGARAGLTAAAAAAVYPNLWINDGLLAAESAYAVGIALVLGAAYRWWFRRRPGDAALLGAAIGLATLARAEAALLFATVALPLVVLAGRRARRRPEDPATGGSAATRGAAPVPALDGWGRLRALALVGGVGAVVLGPWVVRNLTTWDQPVVLSTGAGFVIEISNCDATYAGRYLGYWAAECDRDHTWPIQADVTPDMTDEEVAAAQQAARVESARQEPLVEQRKREEGLRYMREHLDQVPEVVAARLGRMWDVWRPAQSLEFNDFYERRGRRSTLAGMAMYYVLVPLAVGGGVLLRRRQVTVVPPVGIALTVCAAAASSFGITRYRVGADVALCLLAGVALAAGWDRWRPASVAREVAAPRPAVAVAAPGAAGGEGAT